MAKSWATFGVDLHLEPTGTSTSTGTGIGSGTGVRRGLTDALRDAV
ncbi:hypothetical protein JHN45_48320, partial [Streptomyces sp. MBT53]|nr:hypothetical protein [Streptomyces sp. MBT53]